MKKVTVYSTDYCPYCVRAKSLLQQKAIPFEEINLQGNVEELNALKARTGMRTVPQIFIGDELIGGFTDLLALAESNKLDEKLSSQ